MSVEGAEIPKFVTSVRDMEIALGLPDRILSEEERERRLGVRRSAYLVEAASQGSKVAELAIDFRRPGYGIGPDRLPQLLDKKLARDLEAGTRLEEVDLT